MIGASQGMLKPIFPSKSDEEGRPRKWNFLLTIFSGLILALIVGLVLLDPLLEHLVIVEASKIDLFNRIK